MHLRQEENIKWGNSFIDWLLSSPSSAKINAFFDHHKLFDMPKPKYRKLLATWNETSVSIHQLFRQNWLFVLLIFFCFVFGRLLDGYISSYRVISQSLDVKQSSEYCLAIAIGARHTLAPLDADTSHINPDSQSASRRHNSPNFRPYANKQFPITVIEKEKSAGNTNDWPMN